MALQMTRTDEKAEIRSLLDDWAKAARAGDIPGIMAAYAPDVLAFDAIGELRFRSADAYREHWKACMSMCPGMTFEIHDLEIEAGDELAFGHYLARCGGTGPDGKEQSGWMRVTVCCRNQGGRWMVAHEHFSAPFDPETGKARLDLEP